MTLVWLRHHRPAVLRTLGAIAVLFGVATIAAGGRVLFVPEARAAAGAVVPFVLWFNFLAGPVYVASGVGLALQRGWGAALAALIAAATLAASAAFAVHALTGGSYETRTVAAMALRTGVWMVIAAWGYALLLRKASSAG